MIVEEVAEGLSRNGLRDSTKRWPNNELVYYIHQAHFGKFLVVLIFSYNLNCKMKYQLIVLNFQMKIKYRPYRVVLRIWLERPV
jgi:hypothetical protein